MVYAVVMALVLPAKVHLTCTCTARVPCATLIVGGVFMPQGQQVTLELAEQMFEAWRQKQSYSYVASACGISRPTATKYVEHGDPDRGIEAFTVRLRREVRAKAIHVEKRFVYSQAESQRAVREQVRLLDDLIEKACTLLMKDMMASKITLTSIAKAMLARNEIVRRMCPFDEKQVEDTTSVSGTTEFDDWSLAELKYIDHVKKNDRPTEEQLAKFLREHGHKYGLGPNGEKLNVEAEHQRWGAEPDSEEDDAADDN